MAIFGVDAMQALVLAIHTIPAELSVFTRNPGGRFLSLDHSDHDLLHACRTCIETVGDVFPDDAPAGGEPRGGVPRQFFINVDLDVELVVDPTPLVRALEPLAYSLERPEGFASFELNLPTTSPELLIRECIRLIKKLPPDARAVWDGALRRRFDVGFQSLRQPVSETHAVSAKTLTEVAEVGAEIAFTAYSLAPEGDVESTGQALATQGELLASWCFRRKERVVVSAPRRWLDRIEVLLSGWSRERLMNPTALGDALGPDFELAVGPAFQGAIREDRFAPRPASHVRELVPADGDALERFNRSAELQTGRSAALPTPRLGDTRTSRETRS